MKTDELINIIAQDAASGACRRWLHVLRVRWLSAGWSPRCYSRIALASVRTSQMRC